MNLSLLDPFVLAQDYPEALSGSFRSGHSTCLRFNRKGDFLASGRVDGTIVIFDLETNGVARKLRGHVRQIQSLSWSRDGRYLLSSSQDWLCILWDLESGSRLHDIRLGAPVYVAELHPNNHLLFVASLYEESPIFVDLTGPIPIRHTLTSTPLNDTSTSSDAAPSRTTQHATCVTIFHPSGHQILAGTSKGWLNIFQLPTPLTAPLLTHSHRLCTSVLIFLRLTSTNLLVTNSSDRIIRTQHLPGTLPSSPSDRLTLEPEHKFQDVVNRLSWNHCSISPYPHDYILASTYQHHDIYIWERAHGSLVKILEGPREELGVAEWHPHRPFVVAAGLESGEVYYWGIGVQQRWSALAPDFAEVEENVEYVEREDEFDVFDSEVVQRRVLDREDEEVDVLTVARRERRHDGGEDAEYGDDEPPDFRMPVLLDLSESESEGEIVAVGPGTMRRKSPTEGRAGLVAGESITVTASSVAADSSGPEDRKRVNGAVKRARKRKGGD